MNTDNNVNVNVREVKTNYNVNDIDNVSKYQKSKDVEVMADRLLEKLSLDKKSRPFMCKVAYKLSEARIWANLESASGPKVKDKAKLFIWLCDRDMR